MDLTTYTIDNDDNETIVYEWSQDDEEDLEFVVGGVGNDDYTMSYDDHYEYYYDRYIRPDIENEEADDDDDNVCEWCGMSWTDIPNEWGICECICECGYALRECKFRCPHFQN